MERRNFLTGLFGGIVGTGVLIKASDADIQQFASGREFGAPVTALDATPFPEISGDPYLYDRHGKRLAYVTEIRNEFTERKRIDTTRHDDDATSYMLGLSRRAITLRADVVDPEAMFQLFAGRHAVRK